MSMRPVSHALTGAGTTPAAAYDGTAFPGELATHALLGQNPVPNPIPQDGELVFAWSGAEATTAWTIHINAEAMPEVAMLPPLGEPEGDPIPFMGQADLDVSVDGGLTYSNIWHGARAPDYDNPELGTYGWGLPAHPATITIPSLPAESVVGGLRVKFRVSAGSIVDPGTLERRYFGALWRIYDIYAVPTIPSSNPGSGKKVLRLRIL